MTSLKIPPKWHKTQLQQKTSTKQEIVDGLSNDTNTSDLE